LVVFCRVHFNHPPRAEIDTLSLHDALPIFAWLLFWGGIIWQLFQFLNSFGVAGRTIREGGQNMAVQGRDLGESLRGLPVVGSGRSEEHTSELQSRGHLVCRLLLEKKKNNNV